MIGGRARGTKPFQSTSPVWGMTVSRAMGIHTGRISIHIPRVGDDLDLIAVDTINERFQSTSPVWGMTYTSRVLFSRIRISIHIPRVGDDTFSQASKPSCRISIHIPRVGDDRKQRFLLREQKISIHIPRVGDDCNTARGNPVLCCLFLYTLPIFLGVSTLFPFSILDFLPGSACFSARISL